MAILWSSHKLLWSLGNLLWPLHYVLWPLHDKLCLLHDSLCSLQNSLWIYKIFMICHSYYFILVWPKGSVLNMICFVVSITRIVTAITCFVLLAKCFVGPITCFEMTILLNHNLFFFCNNSLSFLFWLYIVVTNSHLSTLS